MKIALLSHEYPPQTGFGGIGTYTWHHARGVHQLGHEVHVLAGARQAQALYTVDDQGVLVHRFWAGDAAMQCLGAVGRLGWRWTSQRLQNAWSMARGLALLQRQHRFDVLEMPECGAEGALLSRRMPERCVVRLHSPAQLIMPFYEVRSRDMRWCAWVERQAMQRTRRLSACSRFVAQETARAVGLASSPQVISNGLDLAWFDAAQADDGLWRTLGLPTDRAVVLFTGRLEKRKGASLFGRIAARLLQTHDVSLVLAGDDLFGHLKREVLPALDGLRLRGSLHHVGHRPIGEIRELVRRCDVFLLPSLWETCPYSAIEAMAAGRPVVAARQGGMPELISDGEDGLLATTGDPEDFARCVGRLLDDAALRQRLGRGARDTVVRRHRHVDIARQAVALYQQDPQ